MRTPEQAQSLELVVPGEFTRDAALQAQYWAVRGGLFTSVGAARPTGFQDRRHRPLGEPSRTT